MVTNPYSLYVSVICTKCDFISCHSVQWGFTDWVENITEITAAATTKLQQPFRCHAFIDLTHFYFWPQLFLKIPCRTLHQIQASSMPVWVATCLMLAKQWRKCSYCIAWGLPTAAKPVNVTCNESYPTTYSLCIRHQHQGALQPPCLSSPSPRPQNPFINSLCAPPYLPAWEYFAYPFLDQHLMTAKSMVLGLFFLGHSWWMLHRLCLFALLQELQLISIELVHLAHDSTTLWCPSALFLY